MSQVESLELPPTVADSGSLSNRFRDFKEQINRRFRRLRDVTNENEGSAVRWDDTSSLPTVAREWYGRMVYWDQGQGATPDGLYICVWNGSEWAWRQVVLDT